MNLLNKTGYISRSTFIFFDKQISLDAKSANNYLDIVAEMIRHNTLLSVSRAGSGHLGASLSSIELLTEIYFRSFYFSPQNTKSKDRDIFILSKGHGAPSLYATLAAKGYFPVEELDTLRRLHGLQGHCDIVTSGIEANTGSLAIGLSKAVGYAIAKKRFGLKGNVIVIVGDGELQEGQCWEAFLSAANFKLDNLYVVIDDNKVQTDQITNRIVNYGKLTHTLENIGFYTLEGKGRSIKEIHKILLKLKTKKGIPKLFWCHTVKGQGVTYMEHPTVLKKPDDKYIWHNMAPNAEQLETALNEVIGRKAAELKKFKFTWNIKSSLLQIPIEPQQVDIKGKSLIVGFSDALVELGKKHKNIVCLDGDLEEDCGYIEFHKKYPKRFIEMGIMEQHMVSTAASLSRLGFIPIISTYAAFLTARANEQIYNLATENARALIVGNMAGVIPATPGKSHQAFRDIACMKSIPGLSMYQPINATDTKNSVARYLMGELGELLYLRLSIAPSALELETPPVNLKSGEFQILRKGKDAIIIGIGPVILGECILASQKLAKKGIDVEVLNYPWLVSFNKNVLLKLSRRKIPITIIEDHYIKGGAGESLLASAQKFSVHFEMIKHLAMLDFPETGFRQEALHFFGLDNESIATVVENLLI